MKASFVLLVLASIGIGYWLYFGGKPGHRMGSHTHKTLGPSSSATIGTATMREDGTIVMRIGSNSEATGKGEARILYDKDHEKYQMIIEHLGGIQPGEEKSIPPWPETDVDHDHSHHDH